MKFKVVEAKYVEWEKIHDEFTDDYLFSDMSNNDIRIKYGMSHGEFRNCCNIVKAEKNISRRPFWKTRGEGSKYYYHTKSGFQIRKRINDEDTYLGFVPTESVAKKIVELCKNASWNVDVCRHLVKFWWEYA